MNLEPIGTLRTPYDEDAPHQPMPAEESFAVELDAEFAPGLKDVAKFEYVYVLYYLDRVDEYELAVSPPWSSDEDVGLFATRAPQRPNPIGLSVVEVQSVTDDRIEISSIDAFDGTPVLDVKPYVAGLDDKAGANHGWIDLDSEADAAHLELHSKGVPH